MDCRKLWLLLLFLFWKLSFLKAGHPGQISFQQGLMICTKKILFQVASRMCFILFSKTMILVLISQPCDLKKNHPSFCSLRLLNQIVGIIPLIRFSFSKFPWSPGKEKSKVKNRRSASESSSCSVGAEAPSGPPIRPEWQCLTIIDGSQ